MRIEQPSGVGEDQRGFDQRLRDRVEAIEWMKVRQEERLYQKMVRAATRRGEVAEG